MEPIPNWLAVMAEVAGMTAFTDEFDRTGAEWNPFNASVPPIETLIGRDRYEGNINNADLKRVVSATWIQNMRPGR